MAKTKKRIPKPKLETFPEKLANGKYYPPDAPTKPCKPRVESASRPHYSGLLATFEQELAEYRKRMLVWQSLREELTLKFKQDLLKHLGISRHKRAEKLFAIAWDIGHGNGFREVLLWAEELATLIK